MIVETYSPGPGKILGIEIAPAPADGKSYPVVVLIHGNLGLAAPFGDQLRRFTEEIAALGYVAALPSFYVDGQAHLDDTDIASHVPALTAAIEHLHRRSDANSSRLGLVGFSLGGGVAASYMNTAPKGAVRVFADFYGYVAPVLAAGVSKFPPTIIFHNDADPVVPVAENSEPLVNALEGPPRIEHEYHGYADKWEPGFFHAFEPGGSADTDSRRRTKAWITGHMPSP
jgi:carboxymethylenebutenolidase